MRCLALARRSRLHTSTNIVIGELSIDVQQHIVTRKGKVVKLCAKDFTILHLLALAYPKALSRNYITAKVWGDDFPDSDALRSHIYTLRNAVDKPFDYSMIKTIHSVGFKLESNE